MMTSAPSYPATAVFSSTVLSDHCIEEENTASLTASTDSNTNVSLRLVKRPLAGHFLAESCKKRRKQSTPIRISNTITGNVLVDDNTINIANSNFEGKLGSFLSCPDNSTSVPTTQFVTDNELVHVKKETAEDCINKNKADSSEVIVNFGGNQNFPSWMSDIQNKPEDCLGSTTTSYSTSGASVYLSNLPHYTHSHSSQQIDVLNQSPTPQQLRNANQPPIRIFNPEAYCEICNKEFCNKYFLKTHKANKHRIYSDPPSTSDISGILVNVPNFASHTFKKVITLPSSSDVTTSKSSDTVCSTLVCDNCGKSFANKTLLITHKANIHGIISEAEQCNDSDDMELSVAMKQREELVESDSSDVNTEENFGMKEINNIKNGYSGCIPELLHVKEESLQEKDDLSLNMIQSTSSQQLKDSADLATANSWRRLGIMNPEAFCEICRKEYCNKYFLRTHKIKRHGLIIPDDNNSRDNQKDLKLELSISNNWYQTQTSPLNLIMNEQNTNSSGSGSERKSSPPNDIECEICGLRFQTSYLAQMHSTVHCKNNKDIVCDDGTVVRESSSIKTEECSTTINNNEKFMANTSDSISEDLQKLQTMILQLNDLDVSKMGATCNVCNKELENRYYLHAHMMTDHGILLEEKDDKQNETECNVNAKEMNLCKICGRDGFTTDELKQHMNECRNSNGQILSNLINFTTSDSKDDSNGFVNLVEKSSNRVSAQLPMITERRMSLTLTPTSSYCEICNKELCNKYFMKTHMQRMHGIEIENGAQIGGVICNICNKELCSKYFLRVHKHNTHGIVEDGNTSTSGASSGCAGMGTGTNNVTNSNHMRQSNDLDNISIQHFNTTLGVNDQCGILIDQSLKPGDLSDLSHRYFTHFTEVCTICSRRFRSTKWLKAHLLGDHGKAGTDKWNELELQLQQTVNQQTRKSDGLGQDRMSPPNTTNTPASSSTNCNQEVNNGTKADVQNVLSCLFGMNETNTKHYQCSFCAFSTPVLAFLFVHERSHTRQFADSSSSSNSSNNKEEMQWKCVVCNQSFMQSDELNHHVMVQHPFLSLGQYFGNVPQLQQLKLTNDGKNELKSATTAAAPSTTTTTISKQDTSSVPTIASDSIETTEHQQTDFRCSKCTQCGKIRKPGRSDTPIKQDELNAEISLTLKDVSKQRQLPTSYALPQRQQQTTKYMMQAFLLDEPTGTTSSSNTTTDIHSLSVTSNLDGTISSSSLVVDNKQHRNSNNGHENVNDISGNGSDVGDRRFAPSIVFLPVLERLTAPLTVSFTLTPA